MSIDVDGRAIGQRNISRDPSSSWGQNKQCDLRHRKFEREIPPAHDFKRMSGEKLPYSERVLYVI